MNFSTPLWTFTELVSADRRQRLFAIKSFDEIIDRIAHGNVDYFTAESRQTYTRAFFKICVNEPDYDAPELRPGDHVTHTQFGEGVVVSCQPVKNDAEVVVAFDGVGVKRLLLSFARLEKM